MPHRAAARKSLKQTAKRTLRNKKIRSRLRTERNKFARMLERGDLEAAEQQLSLLAKLYQQAATRSVIHANNAARQQAQCQRQLNVARAAQ